MRIKYVLVTIKRKIKKIMLSILYFYFIIKLKTFYILFGMQGISNVVEYLPNILIVKILKYLGAEIGEKVTIDSGLILHRLNQYTRCKNLHIGNHVHIGHHMILDLSETIFIDDDTAFGANCQIWTHTGNWTENRSDEKDKINPVRIGKAVIVYSGVIISQGITVGDYARIGAGSVVIGDIDKKNFYAGIPAKFIKTRKDI